MTFYGEGRNSLRCNNSVIKLLGESGKTSSLELKGRAWSVRVAGFSVVFRRTENN